MPVPTLRRSLSRLIAGIGLAAAATLAQAYEVGWRSLQLPAAGVLDEATTVALYYPTLHYPNDSPPSPVRMGAFRVEGAIGAKPIERYRGLLLFSHGLTGSEMAQGRIAEGLARRGWLVAVLRHPHDNWQDPSLIKQGPGRYFTVRPRQASAVLDGLLADPQIAMRLPTDAQGPRVGAIGHSAGGYTVLALAGAGFDLARLERHCRDERADDPIFCRAGADAVRTGAPPSTESPRDPRVRAVAALAPVGVPESDASLASISIPVTIYAGLRDTFLVPRFHGERLAKAIPGAAWHPIELAGHFAFVDSPAIAIGSPDGDIGADPPGFDRATFLQQLGGELDAFFAGTLEKTDAAGQ